MLYTVYVRTFQAVEQWDIEFFKRRNSADIQMVLDSCHCMFISNLCTDVLTLTIRQISCHCGKFFYFYFFGMLMAVGGDLFNVSHCLPPCVKNSHTKGDTEPSWHVISGISSVLRNVWNPPVFPIDREERNVVCHYCPPGSCVRLEAFLLCCDSR